MLASAARRLCLGWIAVMLGAALPCPGDGAPRPSGGNAPGAAGELFAVGPVEGNWQPNSVTAIIQSHQGYLWLGTYHGLLRFDGVSFTKFDAGNTPGLRDGRITSLYESPDRALWIGHETGQLTRMADGQFQAMNLGSNWTGGVIEAITSDEQNDVWVLDAAGLLLRVRDGQTASTPGGASPIAKATLARAKDGRAWMSSNGKVAILDRGTVRLVQFPQEQSAAPLERVFAASAGGVWILGEGWLRLWREGRWVQQIEGFPRLPGAVSVVTETRIGMLVGTMHEGLWLLRPGFEPLHFSRTNGLSHDWVRSLCVDQEGNGWIGTGTGFDGLRPRKIRMVVPPDGWQGGVVRSFSVQPDGTAWVGTEGAGLYRYDGSRWTVFGPDAGLFNLFVWSVLETKEQELFVGTWGGGLFRRRGERFESLGDLSRIKAPTAALYQGRGGEIWIGTQEGLHRYEAGQLVWFAGKDKLVLPDVRTITEDAAGTVWFGMLGGGLGAVRDGAVKQFGRKDGLSSDLVSCLYAEPDPSSLAASSPPLATEPGRTSVTPPTDSDMLRRMAGTLWIGTSDNGLTRLRDGKFSILSAAQGLPTKVICHLVDDGAGQLWMGTSDGILRVNKGDLHRCADGQTSSVHCRNYGRAEGMTSPSCPCGFQPGACKTADGRLWFPTVNGLAVVNPTITNSVPPPVVIEALFLDGSSTNNWLSGIPGASGESSTSQLQSPAGAALGETDSAALESARPLRIPPGHRRFEIRYTGLSFVVPGKVRFRRRLEGLEREWTDAGISRVAEYSYLPQGTYTFKVTACNDDDVWNDAGASVTFTVLPFFWQTLWFRGGTILAGASVLTAGILWAARRRLHRKLERSERQRALERERTRIARDIHDDLGASLTRITMLSQTVRNDVAGLPQAAADLDQIHSTAREITRAMDEIVWAVNPRYDTLDSLAAYLGRFAGQYLGAAGIRCRLRVPVDLPARALSAEVRHNVFLTFKEALHNVVKHAQATEVTVSLELRAEELELLVADNGCGFQRSPGIPVAVAADDARPASGNGLVNMQKRLEEIGGRCDWETAPGEGTRAKFTVVLKT